MSSTCRSTYLIIKVSLMLFTTRILRMLLPSFLENEHQMQTVRSTDILFFRFPQIPIDYSLVIVRYKGSFFGIVNSEFQKMRRYFIELWYI